MKTTIILAALILVGCAHPQQNNPDYQQCQYQAQLATPGSGNMMADAFRLVELTNMCMRMKGYQ